MLVILCLHLLYSGGQDGLVCMNMQLNEFLLKGRSFDPVHPQKDVLLEFFVCIMRHSKEDDLQGFQLHCWI